MTPSEAARSTALIVPELERGTLVVTGSERREWLNGIVTADLRELKPSQGAFGLLLTKQGKITSELWIVAATDALYVSTAPGTTLAALQTLNSLLIMEDAELVDRSSELGWIALHGPRAAELAASGGESRPHRTTEAAIAAAPIDFMGLGGAALVGSRDAIASLTSGLVTAGAVLASIADSERLRIERGLPRYGLDYDGNDNPHEASLERRAVSWTKGCYLGQEVVCMQDMRGKVKRRILPLLVDSRAMPRPGAAVTLAERPVGEVTSVTDSEHFGHPVVLARLRGGALETQAGFEIDGSPARRLDPLA